MTDVFDGKKYFTMITGETLVEKGYNHYKPSLRSDGIACFQKRFDDEFGKKYFIDFKVYDFSEFDNHPGTMKGRPLTVDATSQFNRNGQTFNIMMLVNLNTTIEEVESFYEEAFNKMGFDYYENNLESVEEYRARRGLDEAPVFKL